MTYVVDNMIMRYVVKKESSMPAEKRPVDCSSRTTLEIPLLAPVVRHNGVGVMQISDHNNCPPWYKCECKSKIDERTPVGHLKPRNTIILDNLCGAPDRTGINNTPDHKGNTHVGEDNDVSLSFRK